MTTYWHHWTSDPEPARPPWFDDLVQHMITGTGADRIDGIVAARVSEYAGADFARRVEYDFEYRVQRRGDLVRCTALDGSVHLIVGPNDVWTRRENFDGDVVRTARGRHVSPPDDYEFGTARATADRWTGDDFTTPTGPARETTFLGRPAWEVELAPPTHKPHPLQLVVDRASGLELRDANAAFGTFHEWRRLDTAAVLPDELFSWQPGDTPARGHTGTQ